MKDFECRSRVELEDVRCGAVNVTNMEAVEGRKFYSQGSPVLEEKC